MAARLSELLGRPVEFAEDCSRRCRRSRRSTEPLDGSKVVLLENLRFHAGGGEERSGVREAARPTLADVYVNDAFGSAHRAHASTEGIVHQVKEAAPAC